MRTSSSDEPVCTMVATLGGQPQVVTFALDELLAQGEPIAELLVLHLGPENPRYGRALHRLAAEFAGDRYRGRAIHFRQAPLRDTRRALVDIRDPDEADLAFRAVYRQVADLKTQQRRLHLCVAGGRRLLALVAVSAALFHFEHQDRMWHLYTPEDALSLVENGAQMHVGPEAGIRLVPVPVAPLGAYFPGLRALVNPDGSPGWPSPPDEGEDRRCRAVWAKLTDRERQVLEALVAGATPQEAAQWLNIAPSTVDSHKSVILAECRIAWDLPEGKRLDYHFLREKFGRFRPY